MNLIPALPSANGLPNTVAAHAYATVGTGTDQTPYADAAGTGGIQPALNALTSGGRVNLAARRFDLTAPISVAKHAVSIVAEVAGHNEDPNGLAFGTAGTRVLCTNTDGIVVPSGGARWGGNIYEKLYFYGTGKAQKKAAIRLKNGMDQLRLQGVNLSNFYAGVWVDEEGALDACQLDVNVLGGGYGLLYTSNVHSVYNKITGCCSDLDYAGVLVESTDISFMEINKLLSVRCSAQVDPDHPDRIANIWLRGRSPRVSGCTIGEAGYTYLTNTQAPNAHGLVLDCIDAVVTGNHFYGMATGAAIRVMGSGNYITDNQFNGWPRGGVYSRRDYQADARAWSSNLVDIQVESTASDTVIVQPGPCNIVDSGTRTIINSQAKNAGDPNSAGDWAGIAVKPRGLRIYDTVNSLCYEYQPHYPGGRRVV